MVAKSDPSKMQCSRCGYLYQTKANRASCPICGGHPGQGDMTANIPLTGNQRRIVGATSLLLFCLSCIAIVIVLMVGLAALAGVPF